MLVHFDWAVLVTANYARIFRVGFPQSQANQIFTQFIVTLI